MKHLIRTVVCFFVLVACQQIYAGQSLAVYQGNANVHLLLFETDNPQSIIQSVSIDSDTEYRYLGNPTNIAFFDSPPKMLAYAIERLLEKLSTANQKINKLQLDYLGVFIAGYEVFAKELVCFKAEGFGYVDTAMTKTAGAKGGCLTHDDSAPIWLESKEDFFWRTLGVFNHKLGQTVEFSRKSLKGDHHLITQAARIRLINEQSTYEQMSDVDVVHVTTCAPGYQVRNRRMVEGSSVSSDIPKDGGFHQVGRDACARHLKSATEPFKVGKVYDDIVLNELSSLPVAEEYTKYSNDTILNRWKDRFSNELGIAITMVLKRAALPENDKDIKPSVQELLLPLIVGEEDSSSKYSALQALAQSIRKLEKKGHFTLPEGKKNQIRLLGEFPWDELGLKVFFRDELSAETYSRLDFVTALEYEPMLAIAASYIHQHPELFDEDKDEEDDE